ncbi:hypothetical protein D3C72_1475720 [compost metagenome]
MTLSNLFLRLAVVAALIGMVWGNVMGATHDHSTQSAHAHLNLLGWVSMSIYGLFYRVAPQAGRGRLAWAHFWIAVTGVVMMVPSLPIVLLQYQPALALAQPALALSGLVILAGMALFAIIVFRATSARSAPA